MCRCRYQYVGRARRDFQVAAGQHSWFCSTCFSGGAPVPFSVLALGIMPYISASIIMQLASVVVPSLEALEEGRSRSSQDHPVHAVRHTGTGVFQAMGIAICVGKVSPVWSWIRASHSVLITAITLVTGTMFLMWLGEQITERGLGNGISLLIFCRYRHGLPAALKNA